MNQVHCLTLIAVMASVVVGYNPLDYLLDPFRQLYPNQEVKQRMSSIKESGGGLPTIIIVPDILESKLFLRRSTNSYNQDETWFQSKGCGVGEDTLLGMVSAPFSSGWNQNHNRKLLWLDESFFNPLTHQCLASLMQLHLDLTTNRTSDAANFYILTGRFGSVTSLVSGNQFQSTPLIGSSLWSKYFMRYENLIAGLERVGFQRDVTLLAAPYDFRKVVHEDNLVYPLLHLIETIFMRRQQNHRTVLISFGLGSLHVKHILSQVPDKWQETYLAGWISVGAPWLGSVEAFSAFFLDRIHGWDLMTFAPQLRHVGKSWPSLFMMFPDHDQPLVMGPNRTLHYASNITELLVENYPQSAAQVYHSAAQAARKSILESGPAAVVSMDCVFSLGTKTLQRISTTRADWATRKINWTERVKDDELTFHYGNGDGFATAESLNYCTRWTDQNKSETGQNQNVKIFDGIPHLSLIYSQEFADYLFGRLAQIADVEELRRVDAKNRSLK